MTLEDVLRVIVASRRGGGYIDLFQVFAHVAQQAFVVLAPGQDVDDVPERRPAVKAEQLHVCGDQAGGGSDLHQQSTASANSGSVFKYA